MSNCKATSERPAWVLLAAEGKERGFKNALAFRRWCKRNGVEIRYSGRMEVVVPSEIDAAVLGKSDDSNDLRRAAMQSVTERTGA